MASSEPRGSFAFEVYCNSCRVSLPAGTRRCLHCGAPTSPQRGAAAAPSAADELPSMLSLPPLGELEDAEEAPAKSRLGISFSSLVWLLFLVGYSIYRSCSG